MMSEGVHREGLLLVRVRQKSLVRSPDWQDLGIPDRRDAAVIALDLQEAQFVSSLFWHACVLLNRRLVADGRQLVLLNLGEHQRRLLELVEGGARLPVLDGEEGLDAYLRFLEPRRGPDEGVTNAEKRSLWS